MSSCAAARCGDVSNLGAVEDRDNLQGEVFSSVHKDVQVLSIYGLVSGLLQTC